MREVGTGDGRGGAGSLVRVGRSRLAGLGLFAARRIRPGTRVVEYVGPRLTRVEALARGGRYLFELDDDCYVDGSARSNVARYANHSCAPNCAVLREDGRIWYVTIATVEPGEELTLNYGSEYVARFFPGACRCTQCRDVT